MTTVTTKPTDRSASQSNRKRRRQRDEGRATFQPSEATEVAAEQLMRQHPNLTRTGAIRMLADLGARQAAYDAVRDQRVTERMAAFAELLDAGSTDPPTGDDGWEQAVMSLRN